MRNRPRRLKLGITSKVVTAMFLVVLTTMLLIAFYSYSTSKKLLIDQVERELSSEVENVEATVISLFEQKGEIVRQLSMIPVIESFVAANDRRENARDNKDYAWLQKALQGAKENNKNIELMWLGNIEHNYFIANNDYISDESFNIKTRPWYMEARDKEGLSFSPLYLDYASKKLTISITYPVTVENEHLAYLGTDIHLDDLPALLLPFETDERQLVLVSKEGHVLYDPQNMWATLQLGEQIRKNVQKIETDAGAYYSTVHQIAGLGWKVGIYVPEKVILAPLYDYENSLRWSWFVALLFLLTALSFVLHYLLKDIPVIVRHINKIEQGEFDAQISINRKDEVGEIALAVEQMAKQIKNQLDELDYQAGHDSLTSLANRNSIEETLQRWLDEIDVTDEIMAVVFLDLDHFKQVNDSKGHAFGDELLIQVGKRIEELLPENCLIGRFGGDEFIILIRGKKRAFNQIQLTLQRIYDSFSKPFQLFEHNIYSTASIGVSFYPMDAQSKEDLLVNADTALYHAKENGRNCIYDFTAEMKEQFEKELMLKGGLREALVNNEFSLHYQPQLDIKSGETRSVEALIRWNHPEWGMISPADFIPLSESIGLIGAIGDWVIDTSLVMAKRLTKENIHLKHIAINVSSLQLLEPDFVGKLKERLAYHNVSPALLEIEITESVIMDNTEETIQKLVELKELGIQIALDDFGTGYSSLNYLRMMPIDCVKVDQSFINKIEHDPIVQAIMETIVTLGHSLGFKVVAEGVEEKSQLEILREMNVDCIQGYYHSRPMDEESLLVFLREHLVGKLVK